MITGKIENINTYKGISKKLDCAIEFITSLDINIAPGKYDIDGNSVYANVIEGETEGLDEVIFESHKKYIDLQYIIEGSEVMVYAPVSDCTVSKEYDENGDYCLLKGIGNEISVNAGEFYIVHPFDAHAPGRGYIKTKFKKVVIKIEA